MRWFICVALATLAAGPAFAGTPERDKTWDLLIAEARKHGGEETQYKTSVSYVFRKSDGEFVTFTKMLDSPTRAVCVLSKDQIVTVCGNWDTGKLRYGWRADADAPWSYGDTPPHGQEQGVFGGLRSMFHAFMNAGEKFKMVHTRD
jgi:hypothetical protein